MTTPTIPQDIPCPLCGLPIRAAARLCKHCKQPIDNQQVRSAPTPGMPSPSRLPQVSSGHAEEQAAPVPNKPMRPDSPAPLPLPVTKHEEPSLAPAPVRGHLGPGLGAAVAAFDAENRHPCAFCGESIATTAIKCRFCGESLGPLSSSKTPAATGGGASSSGADVLVASVLEAMAATWRLFLGHWPQILALSFALAVLYAIIGTLIIAVTVNYSTVDTWVWLQRLLVFAVWAPTVGVAISTGAVARNKLVGFTALGVVGLCVFLGSQAWTVVGILVATTAAFFFLEDPRRPQQALAAGFMAGASTAVAHVAARYFNWVGLAAVEERYHPSNLMFAALILEGFTATIGLVAFGRRGSREPTVQALIRLSRSPWGLVASSVGAGLIVCEVWAGISRSDLSGGWFIVMPVVFLGALVALRQRGSSGATSGSVVVPGGPPITSVPQLVTSAYDGKTEGEK